MQTYKSDFFEVISHNSKKQNHNCQIQTCICKKKIWIASSLVFLTLLKTKKKNLSITFIFYSVAEMGFHTNLMLTWHFPNVPIKLRTHFWNHHFFATIPKLIAFVSSVKQKRTFFKRVSHHLFNVLNCIFVHTMEFNWTQNWLPTFFKIHIFLCSFRFGTTCKGSKY